MSFAEKMSLTSDQRSRWHIKGKVSKNVKRSPKKKPCWKIYIDQSK
jgi:hypothetical protein